MLLSEAKIGNYVKFTDKYSRYYPTHKDYTGVIANIRGVGGDCWGTIIITWFLNDTLEDEIVRYQEFFPRRLSHYELPSNDQTKQTKLEKKCRKLWNNSKYVKNNPTLAY